MANNETFSSLSEEEMYNIEGGTIGGVFIAVGLFVGAAVVVSAVVTGLAAVVQWVYDLLT